MEKFSDIIITDGGVLWEKLFFASTAHLKTKLDNGDNDHVYGGNNRA